MAARRRAAVPRVVFNRRAVRPPEPAEAGDLCLDMVAAATFVHRPRVAAMGSSLRRTKPKKVTVATMVMPARMTD